ncbi:MAG: hypothetical protein AB9880_00665 [Christensenellales bacterium]
MKPMTNTIKKIISKTLLNVTLYKTVCICAFMLIPSVFLFFIPKIISAILLLWGAVILLCDLLNGRKFAYSGGSFVLLIFVVGYIITLIFYADHDIISTLNVFFWTISEFFLLYSIQPHGSNDAIYKNMKNMNFIITIVMLISGLLGLALFLANISIVMPDPEGINRYWSIGIVNGRNSGIFNNPIPYSTAMLIGCVAAVWNLFSSDNKPRAVVFYVIAVIVGFLSIQTTLTRTAIYGLLIFFSLVSFFYYYRVLQKKGYSVTKTIATSIAITLLFTVAIVGVKQASQKIMVSLIGSRESRIIILDQENVVSGMQLDGSASNASADRKLKEIEVNENIGSIPAGSSDKENVVNANENTSSAENNEKYIEADATTSKETVDKYIANNEINENTRTVSADNSAEENVASTNEGTSSTENTDIDIVADVAASSESADSAQEEHDKSEIEKTIYYSLGLGQKVTLVRSEIDRLPSFLYPRDELWRIAIQVIPNSPIFGFSSGNRMASSKQYGSSDYLNSLVNGVVTYHNAYLDVAVSAGLLGLGTLLAFLLIHTIQTFRVIFSSKLNSVETELVFKYYVACSYVTLHVLFTSNLFGVLAFNNIASCLYFWILLGFVSAINETALGSKGTLSINRVFSRFGARFNGKNDSM